MPHVAVRVIREEHAALSAMLRSILLLLEQSRRQKALRDLEHALLGFEMLGEPRRAAFEFAATRYVQFYLAHMALEETEILPMAERTLSPQDWAILDDAFAGNRDPLTGHAPERDYRALFTRIAGIVPAPIGLG